ncbi:MAG TPA: hypothetical protein VLX92_31285, partial [Kofleriaceae bacterium]|nr:hypothetical protein [Kofleriaceae bacterium]
LAGCPSVDLGDTPSDIGVCNPPGGLAYFDAQIWPHYLHEQGTPKDCAQSSMCHLNANGLELDPSVADTANYRAAQQYLDCGDPSASWLLTYPLAGIDPHKGGDLFTTSDPEYQVFLGWFAQK